MLLSLWTGYRDQTHLVLMQGISQMQSVVKAWLSVTKKFLEECFGFVWTFQIMTDIAMLYFWVDCKALERLKHLQPFAPTFKLRQVLRLKFFLHT